MSVGVKEFLQRLFVTTLGVLAATQLVSGVHARDSFGLITAALLLGLLNAFLRPIMLLLSLPLLVVTLGLFTLVINAGLLYFVGWLLKSFDVAGFWPAFKGGIVISIVSILASLMIGRNKARIQIRTHRSSRRAPPPNSGSGPVIDV